METVQKAVRDAADGLRNLAFGEQTVTESAAQHGEEPVSGVQGRGTPTDPYDAGNRDEQPGAPQTQDNTAVIPEPLESITPLEVKPTDVSSAQSASDQAPAPAPGAGPGEAAPLPVAPAPSSASHSQPQATTGPGNPAVDQPSSAQEQSNPTAATADTTTTSTPSTASSSSSKPSEPEKPKPAPEQRDQSETMPKGEDKKEDGGVPGGVETGPSTATQNVSVEALKGPQGPAPKDAYEFEKELDGQPSQTKSDEDGGDKGDSGGHHRKMGHMKERLGRVFKHGNH